MKFQLLAISLFSAAAVFAGDPPACTATASPLLGKPWAFQLHTGAWGPGGRTLRQVDDVALRAVQIDGPDFRIPGAAAIGIFTAQPGGTLTANLTVSNVGVISRRMDASGRYILYPDCSGGEILINVNGFAVQLEFVWATQYTQLLFVSDSNNIRYGGDSIVLTGNARVAPKTGCAPFDNNTPNRILDLTNWSYRLSQSYFYVPGDASVGVFKPFLSGTQPLLTAIETSTTVPRIVARRQAETGRYQVYPGCAGGEIMLMNRQPGAVQLEFVFAGETGDEMFLLSDSAINPADVALAGQAFRN